jgi:hypothetical protein
MLVRARPLQPDPRPSAPPGSRLPGWRAAGELREIAYDLVGRPEHDEVSPDERERLALEVDEAVAAVLAADAPGSDASLRGLAARLAAELSSRVESLPVHLRVALANARRRNLLGVD